MSPFERFAECAYERHAIYIRKTLGTPKPWTDKTVFMDHRFCNVFRRIDVTTEWIMQNVAVPLAYDDHLWADLMLARYVSRIDVLEDLKAHDAFNPNVGWDDRRRLGAQRLLERKISGLPTNTAAFITSPMLGDYGPTKAHYIARLLKELDEDGFGEKLSYGFDKRVHDDTITIQDAWTFLRGYRCVGSFMAYQYCCDFTYIPKYLEKAQDVYSWSAPGPGSKRGMSRIVNGRPDGPMATDKWLECARLLYRDWNDYITKTNVARTRSLIEVIPEQESFIRKEMSRFDGIMLQDVQHWLCEFDKYERGGSRKRSYDGRA